MVSAVTLLPYAVFGYDRLGTYYSGATAAITSFFGQPGEAEFFVFDISSLKYEPDFFVNQPVNNRIFYTPSTSDPTLHTINLTCTTASSPAAISDFVSGSGAQVDISAGGTYLSGVDVQNFGLNNNVTQSSDISSQLNRIVRNINDFIFPGKVLIVEATETGGGISHVTNVSISVVQCFASGTRIQQDDCDTAIELLNVGDVVTAHIQDRVVHRSIVWIGERIVDCANHPRPGDVWPVRVRAGAFDPATPARDLVLSPDHAVFADGVLIPIRHLINGTTIVQERRDRVSYWHIELEEHGVVFAEGLPCESYLDTGTRAAFDGKGRVVALHPEFSARRWEAQGCAPLAVAGPVVAAVRARLNERARHSGSAAAA